MSEYAVGIDFGTSTSEICIYRDPEPYLVPDPATKNPIVPSLVAVNTRGELLVGEEARSWVDMEGFGIREVKRKLGTGEMAVLAGKEYRPEEIASFIMRRLRENAEGLLGADIRDVVLSVPANVPEPKRKATQQAAALAGLNVLRLINEPTAAALAFGIKNLDLEEQLVVFDFGGGTLDVTVLEMVAGVLDVKSSFGDPYLGGKDFDEALRDLILDKFKKEHPTAVIPDKHLLDLKATAEGAKIALSRQRSHLLRFSSFATLAGQPVDLEVEISRKEFDDAITPLLDRARKCLNDALAAKRVEPKAVDRVLLVGGTTYVPSVKTLVAEVFGKEPRSSEVSPDLAVSTGASIQAALANDLISSEDGLIVTDVSPFGLGVDVVTQVGPERWMLLYEPLMQPNTTIPYTVKKEYRLLDADQREVNIHVYQDHTGKAYLPADAIDTGISAVITDIPPALYGTPHPIEVEFSYDVNGVVSLKASIPGIAKSCSILIQPSQMVIDVPGMQQSRQKTQDLWRSSAFAGRFEGLLAKAERILGEGLPQGDDLRQATRELKEALAHDDEQAIEKAADRLTDLLFDIENQQ